MSLAMILPMSVFALAASISPGPVNLVCLSSGTRYPLAQGLMFVTGATLGFVVLFVAVGLGLYSVLAVAPGVKEALRWAGVTFLLYLSWRLFRDDGRLPVDEAQRAPGFMAGALMQWLNPKAWLASASGIGAYARPRGCRRAPSRGSSSPACRRRWDSGHRGTGRCSHPR